MKIKDGNGRVGVVDESRDGGVFAHPEGTPYVIEAEDIIGVARAQLITATWWSQKPDGSYYGEWYDETDNFHVAHRLCDS